MPVASSFQALAPTAATLSQHWTKGDRMADCVTKIRTKVKWVFTPRAHMIKVVGSSSVSVWENQFQGVGMEGDFTSSNTRKIQSETCDPPQILLEICHHLDSIMICNLQQWITCLSPLPTMILSVTVFLNRSEVNIRWRKKHILIKPQCQDCS